MDSKVQTPRSWTNSLGEIGLQRTCKLVEEWSERHNAEIQVLKDEDVVGYDEKSLIGGYRVHIREVDRCYRVAQKTEQAANEANMITGFVGRWLKGYREPAGRIAEKLLAAGYSQAAIDEIKNA